MSKCGFCDSSARRPMITCGGICRKKFHADCASVSPEWISTLNSNNGIYWKCRTCRSFEFDVIETKMKDMLQSKCDDLMKSFADKMNEMKNEIITSTLNAVGSKADIAPGGSNEQQITYPKYSEMVKSIPSRKIIVKPRNQDQPNLVTKLDIMQKIESNSITDIAFEKVKPVANGGYVLSANPDVASRFHSFVSEKLSDRYEVKELNGPQPVIKIVGLSKHYEENSLIKLISFQQKHLIADQAQLKVLKVWATKRNKHIYQAKLQVDSVTFKNMLGIGKLNVGLDTCTIYESLDISRCFQCNGYNHTSKNCKSSQCCPLCSEEHTVKECKADKIHYKCSNCFNLKEKQKLSIDINHAAWDHRNCYVYKQILENVKSEILPSK